MTNEFLSIQELRRRLPEILNDIQHGKIYTLVYRSKAVGQLGPMADPKHKVKPLSYFTQDHPQFSFRSKKNAVRLVRDQRGS
jgi:antitoxin (DNA-binding transcriptional repressor) of toxin-antitoxin stability system